jgi:hypothetical protein
MGCDYVTIARRLTVREHHVEVLLAMGGNRHSNSSPDGELLRYLGRGVQPGEDVSGPLSKR